MIEKTNKRISDIPLIELERMLSEYGDKKANSVRSSRIYLRSLGMDIKNDGRLIRPSM